MGIKIKKDTMPRLEDLPVLKIRYTMAIPLIGIVDILTMGSFYANPVTDGHIMLKIFYVINALIGGTFAYWGLRWKTTVDGKKIRVRPAFSAAKELPFTEIKKAVLHKKKKNGSLMYYTLIDSKGQEIVKLYHHEGQRHAPGAAETAEGADRRGKRPVEEWTPEICVYYL